MAIQFTKPQERVLEARKHNILVSAAAGSGKTAVLVERIIRMISEGEDPIDIDRLLVVTFTKAAAAQMRERIGEAIAKKLEEDPGNAHLQRQETLLHNAQITTIDSFFTYILRNSFSDVDMDPGFRQMDQTESDLMRKDALEDFLEEGYAQKDPSLILCSDYFCRGAGDRELEDILDTMYKQAVSHPDPEGWLSKRAEDYVVDSEEALFATPWMQFIVLTAAEKIADLKRQYERMLDLCRLPDGPYLYIPLINKEMECVTLGHRIPSCEEAGTLPAGEIKALMEEIRGILSMKFDTMPRFTPKKYPDVDPAKKEAAASMRDAAKGTVKDLGKRSLGADSKLIMDRMKAPAKALSDLACRFLAYFSEVKREKNVIDFADLEHLALDILTIRGENGIYLPSDAAMAYRRYFDEILIDEYQDSNEVQELLLSVISTEDEGKYNRFMVGDVKQSIYKFRLARPEIFIEKLGAYREMDPEKERIDLDSNFRSRKEVLDSVNDVFFRLMRREIGGIEYSQDVSLKPGAPYAPAEDPDTYKTEFLLVAGPGEDETGVIDDEILALNNRRKEALAVAARIRDLVGKLPVNADEGGRRPCRYGDIVVLLRSSAGWNEDFRSIFEKQGIPYYIESKTGYFSASEIQSVLEMLRVLDNPLQDIPLYGVLRGYWGGFDEEEIARIRLALQDRDADLYSCVLAAAQDRSEEAKISLGNKCREFLDFLSSWREKTLYMRVNELLRDLVTETGYDAWCGALPGGEQRSANLRMLLAQAASFDAMGLSGLFDFIRYIDQIHHRDVDYGEANILDENADVVRIMTIHKSKGLEFPVCFVAGTGKRHSYKTHDTRGSFICDNDWGIGMDYWDPASRTRYSTARKEAVADKIRRESLGEELRVLYVAMTRAKEKLILTGFVDNMEKKCGEWEKMLPVSMEPEEKLPISLLTESEHYLELLWYAVSSQRENNNFRIRQIRCSDLIWNEMEQQEGMGLRRQKLDQASESGGAPLPDPELARRLEEIYSRRYAGEDLKVLYTKTSVSELKIASLEEENGEGAAALFPENLPSPTVASFAKEETGEEGDTASSGRGKFSGTDYGSAVHRILELFDYTKFTDPSAVTSKDLDEWRDGLAAAGRIPRAYAEELPAGGILAFLKSGLAGRMAAAEARGQLYREQPFVLGIEADKLNSAFPHSETVLVQGIIDAYFEEDGELVLVDYKTDRVSAEQELTERYQIQLDLYERALAQITGKKVKEKLIYALSLRRTVRLF